MQELGADETVDYTKDDFAQKYKNQPFDVIVDPIGGALLVLSPATLCLRIAKQNAVCARAVLTLKCILCCMPLLAGLSGHIFSDLGCAQICTSWPVLT